VLDKRKVNSESNFQLASEKMLKPAFSLVYWQACCVN